jgi:hypothetical protein
VQTEDAAAGLEGLAAAFGARDFLVQDYLRQHPDVAALHPASLNTVRVLTLRAAGRSEVLSTLLQASNDGAWEPGRVTGGLILCAVGPTGTLGNTGVDKTLRTYAAHPFSGVRFAGRAVPGYSAIAALARGLHDGLGHFDFVVWEFGVDEGGTPRLIDVNLRQPGIQHHQALCGPLFGAHTDGVLARAFGPPRPR